MITCEVDGDQIEFWNNPYALAAIPLSGFDRDIAIGKFVARMKPLIPVTGPRDSA